MGLEGALTLGMQVPWDLPRSLPASSPTRIPRATELLGPSRGDRGDGGEPALCQATSWKYSLGWQGEGVGWQALGPAAEVTEEYGAGSPHMAHCPALIRRFLSCLLGEAVKPCGVTGVALQQEVRIWDDIVRG